MYIIKFCRMFIFFINACALIIKTYRQHLFLDGGTTDNIWIDEQQNPRSSLLHTPLFNSSTNSSYSKLSMLRFSSLATSS